MPSIFASAKLLVGPASFRLLNRDSRTAAHPTPHRPLDSTDSTLYAMPPTRLHSPSATHKTLLMFEVYQRQTMDRIPRNKEDPKTAATKLLLSTMPGLMVLMKINALGHGGLEECDPGLYSAEMSSGDGDNTPIHQTAQLNLRKPCRSCEWVDCLAENTHLILHAIEGIIENLKELEEILMYDVDHRNRYGPAALMEAALLGHWDFVEELINANKDLEDNEGCTALELAENCGRNKKERLRRRHPNYAPESTGHAYTFFFFGEERKTIALLVDDGPDPDFQTVAISG
ncbi:hypothetical protein FPQ18DRAFT_306493 [Pyronema domesticum]|nr:hypothetical protein FPQ18DRAFT_306493 [Pyronema domesticum]